MNRISRVIGLSAVLLLVFLAAVVVSQYRIRRHTETYARDLVHAKQQQLEQVLVMTKPGPLPWSEDVLGHLGQILDAEISILPASAGEAVASPTPDLWQFLHAIKITGSDEAVTLKIKLHPPAMVRLLGIYQHTAMVLLALALGLLFILGVVAFWGMRNRTTDTSAPINLDGMRAEMSSLSHLAQVSIKQGNELNMERNERMRAEEDLNFKQLLLNRALEEKIRLGRDLHDGIIQSLYATGLTLEAAKNHLANSPESARTQLETGLTTLNATIRDVRSYIAGLGPDDLRRQTFAEAVRSLAQTIDAGRKAEFEFNIDENAAARLGETQFNDLLQILREAVSNALRHGTASRITIRFHENNGDFCLLVQDNGQGFNTDSAGTAESHGLTNMQARARRLGGTLNVHSAPAQGARIVLLIPMQPAFATS